MAGRQRLDQIDAMRPLKQVGVVSTHTIIAFAPAWAAVLSNATLLLLHVSREVFFSISACMLTYAYAGLKRDGWRTFYWRRFVSVGIPYLCWNAHLLPLVPLRAAQTRPTPQPRRWRWRTSAICSRSATTSCTS